MYISEISILIFNFLMSSVFFVHLQEEGCVYSYSVVRFICIDISSLVGRRVCSYLLDCLCRCM